MLFRSGLVLLSAWNRQNPVQKELTKARFRYKANRLKNTAVNLTDDLADKAKSTFEDVKKSVLSSVN